jgi:1-acyl-sn-glycerol-3-phosphate acyltransferase
MQLFILVAFISVWAICGIAIANKAYAVTRFNLACRILDTKLQKTPQWKAFIRPAATDSSLPSRAGMLVRAMFLGPPKLFVCALVVVLTSICAFLLPKSKVASMARFGARTVLSTLGLTLRVTGFRTNASVAPCIVANHISAMDILVFLSLGASFVANEAVLKIPGIGIVAKSIGCIFVERDSPESRADGKAAISRHLKTMDRSPLTPQLVIFPEGTTTSGIGLLQFRRGAFSSGVKVQPARLTYRNKQCSMTLLSLMELVSLLCVLPRSEVTVTYLPSVDVALGENGPDEMASACRSKIASVKGEELLELYESGSHRDEKSLTEFITASIAIN